MNELKDECSPEKPCEFCVGEVRKMEDELAAHFFSSMQGFIGKPCDQEDLGARLKAAVVEFAEKRMTGSAAGRA